MTTVEHPPPIGPRIRALRDASGLSLRDLADRSGVSAPMLSQVERGETSPTLATATRIAAGLDLRLSQLLRLDEGGGAARSPPGGGAGGVGGGPAPPPMHEPGSRESTLVQEGRVVLEIDGE